MKVNVCETSLRDVEDRKFGFFRDKVARKPTGFLLRLYEPDSLLMAPQTARAAVRYIVSR
jgi:hypothetical protein